MCRRYKCANRVYRFTEHIGQYDTLLGIEEVDRTVCAYGELNKADGRRLPPPWPSG